MAQMLALDTAIKNKGVLFVSAEMDKETLANRMISALSLIPYDELHNARMSSGVMQDFTNAQATYAKLPIWIEPKQKADIKRSSYLCTQSRAPLQEDRTWVHRY